MASATELLRQIGRDHVLVAIGQLDAGATSRFADSRKFDVLYRGRRYAPKEVAGLALEALASRTFGPRDFSGGDNLACFSALERCGFTIVHKRRTESTASVTEVIAEILQLQTQYASTNTPEMRRRGELIRYELPDIVRDHLETIEPHLSQAGYVCSVQGSDGVGRKNESPWVRIFDPEMSPSATQGWYVVLHFARDGQTFFSTLGCGATVYRDGSLFPVPDYELASRVAWAKGAIANAGYPAEEFSDAIQLQGNELSRQFEKATALARAYRLAAFSEEEFWRDIESLSQALVLVYERERLGKAPLSENPEVRAAQQGVEAIARPQRRGGKGQGRSLTFAERIAVEQRAMKVAVEGLVAVGFSDVHDRSATESYDLVATKDGLEWYVEVKGTTSVSADEFMITAAELKLHRAHLGRTVLAIVSNIDLRRDSDQPEATGGALELKVPWEPDEWEFEPTGYRASRKRA